MYRIDGDYDAADIRKIAQKAGAKVALAKSRCQHGHTREEFCVQCENGYVDDCHSFALLRSEPAIDECGNPLYGETMDGEEVCYISNRFQSEVDRVLNQIEMTEVA